MNTSNVNTEYVSGDVNVEHCTVCHCEKWLQHSWVELTVGGVECMCEDGWYRGVGESVSEVVYRVLLLL